MATQKIDLTETGYIEIGTTGIYVSAYSSGQVIITNADTLPPVEAFGHPVLDGDSRVFLEPASGAWYAKVSSGSGSVTVSYI